MYARRDADGTLSGKGNLTHDDAGAPAPEPSASGILDEACFRTGEQRSFTTSTWAAVREVPAYHPPGARVDRVEAAVDSSGQPEIEVLFGSHARMKGSMVPANVPGHHLLEQAIIWFHELYSRAIVLAVAFEVERRAHEMEVSGEQGLRDRQEASRR